MLVRRGTSRTSRQELVLPLPRLGLRSIRMRADAARVPFAGEGRAGRRLPSSFSNETLRAVSERNVVVVELGVGQFQQEPLLLGLPRLARGDELRLHVGVMLEDVLREVAHARVRMCEQPLDEPAMLPWHETVVPHRSGYVVLYRAKLELVLAEVRALAAQVSPVPAT